MGEENTGRVTVEAAARSRAAPPAVFALLKDGSTWPQWTMFTGFELERPGKTDPLGVGAIRVFKTAVSKAREEVVDIEQDRRLSYILLSGFPMVNYRADVTLEADPGGETIIHWRSRFDPKYPGTGWFWRRTMHRALTRVAGDLARAAERLQASAG
jgi:uncharacterized protein YndB with AHSA1/START domain